MRYIALDMGSSFTKVAALDMDALRVGDIRTLPTPPNMAARSNLYEIDMKTYFAQIKCMLDGMLDAYPDARGILISTQMHGYVLTDARFRLVAPYVSWRDRAFDERVEEGISYLESLSRRMDEHMMYFSGTPLKGNLSAVNLSARIRLGQRFDEKTLFHTLGGYVLARLGGEYVCHITNAAPSGLVCLPRGKWDDKLITQFGLRGFCFPRITTQFEPCGIYKYRSRTIELYPDIADHQACVAGCFTRPGTDLNINIGTAGLTGVIRRGFTRGQFETRPFFDGLYLYTVTNLPGGRHLEALAKCLCQTGRIDGCDVWSFMAGCFPGPSVGLNWQKRMDEEDYICPPSMELEPFVQSVFAHIAAEYGAAAARLGSVPKRLTFSGGCVQRNAALRAHMIKALSACAAPPAPEYEAITGLMLLMHCAQTGTQLQDFVESYSQNLLNGGI